MQPGGKFEPDEFPVNALIRELREELGMMVDPGDPVYLGRFSAPAANEPEARSSLQTCSNWSSTSIQLRPAKSKRWSGCRRKTEQN